MPVFAPEKFDFLNTNPTHTQPLQPLSHSSHLAPHFLCLPLPLPLPQLLFGYPKKVCMSLIASFLAALIFSSLLFCQFCFYPATHLAASPFTSASASASTCHCLYLCYNSYLVVLNSVCVLYCFFFGCFYFFSLLFL